MARVRKNRRIALCSLSSINQSEARKKSRNIGWKERGPLKLPMNNQELSLIRNKCNYFWELSVVISNVSLLYIIGYIKTFTPKSVSSQRFHADGRL